MAITLAISLLLWTVAAVVVHIAFRRAPPGYEDDEGFHPLPQVKPASPRETPPLREWRPSTTGTLRAG